MDKYYVGVRSCGCITAAMLDDESTTVDDVNDFYASMADTGRHVEHREAGRNELIVIRCPHKETT